MNDVVTNVLRARVIHSVERALNELGMDEFDVASMMETPPSGEMGDYAFPCFQLAGILRKPPQAIAKDLADKLPRGPWLDRVEVVQAYVNFFLAPGEAARAVIDTVFSSPDGYGRSDMGSGRTVVIEFSSPNIAKPFHVGHLRSTIIGHSLARIFASLGFGVVRLNHLGDWGTQFGKLIVAYRRWGDAERLKDEPIRALLDLYVRFHQEAEGDPALDEEARSAFKALEDGREEERAVWEEFRILSLREFEKHYKRLGVTFDAHLGESAYVEQMEGMVRKLEEKELLTESEGALVVELDDLPPCLIKKRDGATLYATRDLAAALRRHEAYEFERLLYVVGAPQQLHFQQVFAVLDRMGCSWVERCEHIPFGHIRIGDVQLSTRKGNVVFLEDLLDEAVRRALAVIDEHDPDMEEKERVAEMVGIGAVVFNDLSHNRIKDISFDWETALNFEGDTGPYVQYTYARTASLLRHGESEEAGPNGNHRVGPTDLTEPETFQLVKRLAEYPEVVQRAVDEREPSEVARYLLLLCRDFNSFYHAHRILGSDVAPARLALTAAVKHVIASGLYLLGIEAPESM